MRYIDADVLIRRFKIYGGMPVPEWIINVVNTTPTADVAPERKTAEWVYGENDGQDGWYCSECHFFIPWYYDWYGLDNIDFIKDFHACPHCSAKMVTYTGAKMDGGNDA